MWNEEEAVKKEKAFIVVNRSEGMWNECGTNIFFKRMVDIEWHFNRLY